MATYVAISGFGGDTTGVEALGVSREEALRLAAEGILRHYGTASESIQADTLFKNLRVLPISRLQRTAWGRAILDEYDQADIDDI